MDQNVDGHDTSTLSEKVGKRARSRPYGFKLTFCRNSSLHPAPLQLEWRINNLGSAVNQAIKLSVSLFHSHILAQSRQAGRRLIRAHISIRPGR